MDEHGYFNFGPSASHLGAVCEKARKIIVEVNTNMPRCLGGMENCVPISQVTGIVEGDNPPLGQMAAAGPASEDVYKRQSQTLVRTTMLHSVQQGDEDTSTGSADRVAQSDCAAVDVQPVSYTHLPRAT